MSSPLQSHAHQSLELADILKFNPHLWWDPVPDWLLTRLDDKAILTLGEAMLAQRAHALEGQMNLVKQVQEVVRGTRGG